jgi:hypothetical protein
MYLDVYNLSLNDGRSFIKLGNNHNYGHRYELICWINGSDADNINSLEHLSLLYVFELKNIRKINHIHVKDAIPKIKTALIKHKLSTSYKFYHSYICVSVKHCLSTLLEEYSYTLLYTRCATKIQLAWLERYYNPKYNICKKRLIREYSEMEDYIETSTSTSTSTPISTSTSNVLASNTTSPVPE